MPKYYEDGDTLVRVNVSNEKKEQVPKQYHVLIHNDNITDFIYVVEILMDIFEMDEQQAIQTMMRIHLQGIPGAGVAGTYIRSVAEEKLDLIQARNDSTGHSLMATMQLAE